jgi:hypothetical protein
VRKTLYLTKSKKTFGRFSTNVLESQAKADFIGYDFSLFSTERPRRGKFSFPGTTAIIPSSWKPIDRFLKLFPLIPQNCQLDTKKEKFVGIVNIKLFV